MSKPVLDSDLYGDLYTDEFTEFLDDSPEQDPPTPPAETDAKQPGQDSPSVSYSAQVAQQFSAYKQTPSQERQNRLDSVFGKKPSEMHDSGKLFVGGLSWDTTDEGLRDYFEQFGKVDACTIMREPSGTSRGFAFLTFEDAASAEVVFEREHTLDGKQIDPKRAIPREEHLRNARYFVGGLSHSTTVESMRTFFSQFGKVVDATVMLDRETGRSKGFGFVTFEDNGSGLDQTVVGKGLLTLDDKEIEVKLAQPRSQREQTRNLVNKITGARESTPDHGTAPPAKMIASSNPMRMMFPRHLPMMANPMPNMMLMNPMMSMGMGMGMAGMGMNALGGMVGNMPNMNMNMMGGMNWMQNMPNMGLMRMGPMGMVNPPGMLGMAAMPPMSAAGGGMGNAGGMAKNAMNSGLGPVRMNNKRQQHGFHPYSR